MTDNQLDRSQDSQIYYYDTAQRFTKMERGTIGGTPSFYQGYTLDGLANWSSFNNNGSSESRTHNSMNAVTVRGSTNLTYDANGNLTNDGNQKYIWDSLNRLIEVRDSSNNIICDYYYNADNLRVEKHHAGGLKEQFYYDDATVLVETDGSQNKVREYVNGGQYIDEVILVVNGSTYNYYMSDLRYCVTGFIDSSGNVVERARYDGYGKRTLLDASYATITTPNVNQSYGYTGIRHDNESGLQYYRARYFDNYLGRFINRDPIGYVDGLNLYRGYFIINDTDSKGTSVSKATVNAPATDFGERNGRAVNWANDGYTNLGGSWQSPQELANYVKVSCNKKSVSKIRGSLTISSWVSQTPTLWSQVDMPPVRGYGNYTAWHESVHARLIKDTWDKMADEVNQYDGVSHISSKSKCDCCSLIKEYIELRIQYWDEMEDYENYFFHHLEFGGTEPVRDIGPDKSLAKAIRSLQSAEDFKNKAEKAFSEYSKCMSN